MDSLALVYNLSYLARHTIVQLLVYLQPHDKKSLEILFDRFGHHSYRPIL